MIRICAWCKKKIGEKEPFDDRRETHGICDDCIKKELNEDQLKQTKEKYN